MILDMVSAAKGSLNNSLSVLCRSYVGASRTNPSDIPIFPMDFKRLRIHFFESIIRQGRNMQKMNNSSDVHVPFVFNA